MSTSKLNDMARIAQESFTSLFGEREEDIKEAGFDPKKSAWHEDDDQDEEGDDD